MFIKPLTTYTTWTTVGLQLAKSWSTEHLGQPSYSYCKIKIKPVKITQKNIRLKRNNGMFQLTDL